MTTFQAASVEDIRDIFRDLHGRHGVNEAGLYEITGASFIADEPFIFGEPNDDYIRREIAWYETAIPNIYEMKGEPPTIWKRVASELGFVNSQYGYLIYSEENNEQYEHVLNELKKNCTSRRGAMIYTRPSIHVDATANGMDDFICTNAVNYFIHNGVLDAVVQMRSNDVVFGYRNDLAWQRFILAKMARDLDVGQGTITWQAASLHIYPLHFNLIK